MYMIQLKSFIIFLVSGIKELINRKIERWFL